MGRRWMLDQVAAWTEQGPERYFLILGKPGTGKTALAAWLAGAGPAPADPAERARLAAVRQGWAATHFIVARGQRGTVNPAGFAQSLAQQLAQWHPAFAAATLRRIAPEVNITVTARENWGTMTGARIGRLIVAEQDAEDVYDRIVRQPLQELAQDEPGITVRILVDALDEGEAAREAGIASLIAGSGDFPPGVRFLLTTRNEPRVVDQFDGARTADLSSPDYAAAAEADLTAYMSGRFAADARLRAIPATVARAFQDRLLPQASGNFLYVRWVLDELSAGSRDIADVTSLPEGLYGLYRTFLDRVIPSAPGEFARIWLERQEPFFGALTVASPAAPREALQRWLSWSGSELNVQLEQAAQLIDSVPDPWEKGAAYRLYHSSIADYLSADSYSEHGERRNNRYYVDPARHHRRIARHYLDMAAAEWSGDWTNCDQYGLSQLPTHLFEAGDHQTLLELLKPSFLGAKAQRMISYQPVMTDLQTGFEVAERRVAWPVMLRLAVGYTGIKDRYGDLPTGAAERLISIYAETGSVQRAVELASMIDTPWQRAVVMREIVERLAVRDPGEATRVAEQITDDPFSRAEALEKVLDAIAQLPCPTGDLSRAASSLLALIGQIEPVSDWQRYWRAHILEKIARTLQRDDQRQAAAVLAEAISQARAVGTDQWRYETLRSLAAQLAPVSKTEALGLYDEALAAIAQVSDKGWSAPQVAATIGEIAALDLAHATRIARTRASVVEKAFALAAAGYALAKSNDVAASSILDEARAAAAEIPHLGKSEAPSWESEALAKIAWAIAAQDTDRAVAWVKLQRARLSPWDSALALIATDQSQPFDRRLSLAGRIADADQRGTVLAALSSERLPHDIDGAAGIISGIPGLSARRRALVEAAASITDSRVVAAAIIDEAERLVTQDDCPPALAARLGVAIAGRDASRATRLLQQALDAADDAGGGDRLETYGIVARHLATAGEPARAALLIRQALKSSYEIRSQRWVANAQALLLGEIARHDGRLAVQRALSLPGTARVIALGCVISRLAETDAETADWLFTEHFQRVDDVHSDEEIAEWGADTLAALVVTAARNHAPDTVGKAKRLWRYGGRTFVLDLKTDTLAKASGLLARYDLDGAESLLRIVLSGDPGQGDPAELGRALAQIARRDSALAEQLSAEIASSLSSAGGDDESICVMCESLADVLPDHALAIVGDVLPRNAAPLAGYRSKVLSRAAAAVAAGDRTRAEYLIDRAIRLARLADYGWLVTEALLEAARALARWDPARGGVVFQESLDCALDMQNDSGRGRAIAHAAAVVGDAAQARALAEQAIDVIEAHPDADVLEAIAATLADRADTLLAPLLPRLLQALFKGGDLMLEGLTLIIPLLIQADTGASASVARVLWDEFDTALALVEEVFAG